MYVCIQISCFYARNLFESSSIATFDYVLLSAAKANKRPETRLIKIIAGNCASNIHLVSPVNFFKFWLFLFSF